MNAPAKTMFVLIDDENILALCREDKCCFVDNSMVIFTSDPDSENLRKIVNEVKKLRHGADPEIRLVDKNIVLQVLDSGISNTSDAEKANGRNVVAKSTHVEERLMHILTRCIKLGGSDVHILVKGGKTTIKSRVDGRLVELTGTQPKEYGVELTSYIFSAFSGSEETYSPLIPNAGGFNLQINLNNQKRRWDWRSSMIPVSSSNDDQDCTKTVLRLLTPIREDIPSFSDMGMDDDHIKIIDKALKQPQGAILFSGPTGSGKTTVAMAGLSEIDEERNINTLEDPPEWSLNGVAQTRIDYGLTKKGQVRDFAYYGKVMLRQDPDVIYFGELRDQRGAAEFTHLSESGHLLLGTTHTSSATGIATKLVEHLRVPGVVASSPDVFSVFSHQRLARKVCPHCSIPHEKATEEQRAALVKILGENLGTARFKNPEGCKHCVQGEKGRTLVMEVIELTDEDRAFIAKGDALIWRQHLINNGWKSIQFYAKKKIRAGICDIYSVAEQVKELI